MKKDAPFQKEGIMSISKALTTNVDSKVNKIVEGAKRQGIDFDKYNEQEIKYILELNKKKLEPRVISADSPEGRGITKALLGRKEGKVIKGDFGKPFKEESDEIMKFKKIAEEDREIENLYGSAGFGKDQKVDAEFLAEYLAENAGKVYDDLPTKERLDFYNRAFNALTRYKRTKGTSVIDEPKKLDPRTKEKMDDMKDIEDPEDMAQGGRAGFKIGGIDKARRAFLKAAAGVTGGIAALKTGLLNIGKGTTKQVAKEIITTPNAPGKPEWFDALVTKVVNEGTDVTKGFATKERELVHTKQINDFAEVTVYRDLDTNTTIVNYGSKLRRDPTKAYERDNIQPAVNDPDQIDLVGKGAEDVEPTIIEK